MKSRINYIDEAKAIGIILVILGHCVSTITKIPYLVPLIVSFHMPLFFIISGFFNKELSLISGVKKYGKSYMKPYFIGCTITFVSVLVYSTIFRMDTIEELKLVVIGTLCGSGGRISNMWFLFALFWACTIFSYLKTKLSELNLFLTCIVIFLFAVILAKHVPQPFSFFSGCCGVLYLWIGYFARKNNVIEKLSSVNVLVIIALLLLSGYSISLGELNLSACKFPGGILTFITSIVITFSVLYILSKNLFTNIIAGMPFASVVPGLARGAF